MTLRCKAGDLAVVTKRSDTTATNIELNQVLDLLRVGTVVKVGDAPFFDEFWMWPLDKPVLVRATFADGNWVSAECTAIADYLLTPIRGDEQPESISTDRTEPVTA